MIRHAVLAALMVAAAGPALAQTTPAPQPLPPFEMPRADDAAPGVGDLFRFPPRDSAPGNAESSPMDDLLNNLLRRAQPHLEGLARDMGGLVNEYAPVLDELSGLMDDIGNYEMPPERLPNGDILIRRKAGAPPPPPLEQLPNFLPRGTGPVTPQDSAPRVTPPVGGQTEL